MMEFIDQHSKELNEVINNTCNMHKLNVGTISLALVNAFDTNHKAIIFGNGGSYADALHFAAEFEGTYKIKGRRALPVIVPANTAALTAIGNDYGYDVTFKRFVEANAQENDVVIGLSTSGSSLNIIEALRSAKKKNAYTIGLTGRSGGVMNGLVDILINIPSDDTARIQEAHQFICHEICYTVENKIFGPRQ
jgi:D-sedoheptulose 7-phosphate isomerase